MTAIVVHLGAHRTGSTLIQSTLAHNAAALAPEVRLALPREVFESDFFQFCLARRLAREEPDRAEGLRLFRQGFLGDPRPKVILSHEGLLGELMHRSFYGSPAYRRFLFGVLDALGAEGHAVTAILYMRPIPQLLRSMHVRHVHEKGGTETFEAFRDAIDTACYRWEPIVEDARRDLARGRLVTRTFDAIAAPEVLAAFAADAGLPPLGGRDGMWTRRSPSPEEVEAIRRRNVEGPDGSGGAEGGGGGPGGGS